MSFDCWYIRTHTKEKPSKISYFIAILSTFESESTFCDKTIRRASKKVHSWPNKAKIKDRQSQVRYIHKTHFGSLHEFPLPGLFRFGLILIHVPSITLASQFNYDLLNELVHVDVSK